MWQLRSECSVWIDVYNYVQLGYLYLVVSRLDSTHFCVISVDKATKPSQVEEYPSKSGLVISIHRFHPTIRCSCLSCNEIWYWSSCITELLRFLNMRGCALVHGNVSSKLSSIQGKVYGAHSFFFLQQALHFNLYTK